MSEQKPADDWVGAYCTWAGVRIQSGNWKLRQQDVIDAFRAGWDAAMAAREVKER